MFPTNGPDLRLPALAVLALLWASGPGSARAGEILWHYDTGG